MDIRGLFAGGRIPPQYDGRPIDPGFQEGGPHETFRQYVDRASRELAERQKADAPGGLVRGMSPSLFSALATRAARQHQLESRILAAKRLSAKPAIVPLVTEGDLVTQIKKTARGLRQRLPRPRKPAKKTKKVKKAKKETK